MHDTPGVAGRIAIRVRDRVWWSDVDKMGIMYFGRYVRFAEMAETEFFRALGFSYDALHERFGIWLARVRLEIDYRQPARLDDELVCDAAVVKVAASSMHFRFAVERVTGGKRLAEIRLVIACLDAKTLRAARIPAALHELLHAQLAPNEL